jgi:molecular chaperone GrpE (heat shock protein)
LKRLREELKQAKEEHRQKENKWMASQTKVQEKIRTLEIRNRELTDSLEKVRTEEQNLRRRLNASLRPGAVVFL